MINRLMFAPLFSLLLLGAQSFAAVQDDTGDDLEPTNYSVNTFYALLVAEMAGQRQLYDVALGNYLLESHRTQDAGVTARATQIAQFIGADQAALDAATLWVKLDPKNPLAQQALSSELVKAARFSESALHLQKALDLDPLLNVNFISLLGVDMSEGSRELWLESLTPLVSRYKANQALLFNIASLHQQQQNYDDALNICSELLKQHPEFYPAWSLKSRLLATQEKFDDAIKTINAALKHFKDDKSFLLLKARLLIKNKEIEKASDTFYKLHTANPHDAQILLPLALTQLEQKKYDDAKLSLQKLLNLHQMQSEAHYYLARIEQYNGNDKAALNHYLAMKGGREYLAAQGAIINIYLTQKDSDKALAHVRQQRTIDNENQQAYFLMEVDILNRTGQYDASLTVLNAALNAYQDSTDLRYSRAMVAEKLGNMKQLEKDLEHIISLEPDNATALNALGYTLADRSTRLDEAQALIEKALTIAPKDPAILDSLGWVYFRLGKLKDALDLLQQAFAMFPDAEVAAHLGEVLWAMGDKLEAKDVWRKALEKTPDSQILKDTLLRLEVDL
ncbi:tetratricopeptide repeat protein [Bermanella sp. WJH001]|uniref:tetratricopeptide repeat protein n=1 Tax=Bermanella sp. WJH001 TaxID=3048005 RepID=UPI0024BE9BDB|nr:tetratricopeptide repeat protein [Bermanella sp. WJH001]MDJ1538098.1 tetratricopeptide repeat protein [Bermanella sp. WJH001]